MREHRHSKSQQDKQDNLSANFLVRTPRTTLDPDLILPKKTRLQIDECLTAIRHHRKIYYDWNFRSVDPLGQGRILNFYGPPGTGKTLAAEAFAGTLGLPFISIGIADIESKFMGETAKQIQLAFKQAFESEAILFFDEADTMLGKRLTSVTQGVDHEVNSMRSTLLIEIERFEGIAIFASNFATNYDEAFRSRISYHIRFELPDFEARASIWRRMLVREIPVTGSMDELVDMAAKRSEGFSGREIRTCMRLALPKALRDEKHLGPALTLGHVIEAINEVMRGQIDIASSPSTQEAAGDLVTARAMLGLK